MKEFTVEKLQELENDQEFGAKMSAAKTTQDVLAVMEEFGIAMTAEDGELSETALDAVSGGGWLWDWFKSWFDKQSKKNADEIGKILDNM